MGSSKKSKVVWYFYHDSILFYFLKFKRTKDDLIKKDRENKKNEYNGGGVHMLNRMIELQYESIWLLNRHNI